MFYNDGSEKQREEEFQKKLAQMPTPEQLKAMDEELEKMMVEIRPLLKKPNRTKKENRKIQEVYKIIEQREREAIERQPIIEEQLWRAASMHYQNVKRLAAKGNELAIQMLKEFKPTYFAILREQSSDN